MMWIWIRFRIRFRESCGKVRDEDWGSIGLACRAHGKVRAGFGLFWMWFGQRAMNERFEYEDEILLL